MKNVAQCKIKTLKKKLVLECFFPKALTILKIVCIIFLIFLTEIRRFFASFQFTVSL
jgi:hypothetical protein